LSTGQLIVTFAFVGLLGALHLVLRTVREPASASSVAAPRPAARSAPLMALLVVGAVAALAFAGVAFVVSVLDEDEEATAPATQPAPTPGATGRPPPPQPPPPPAPAAPIRPPAGTAFVANVLVQTDGLLVDARNQVGDAPNVEMRETGVYEVEIPGLTARLRRTAVVRVRPANGTPDVMVTARKVGPSANFMVFTRDEQTGAFADSGFEFAVFLPEQELEGTAGEAGDGRPQLPPTR
jgi:hypothetical protein